MTLSELRALHAATTPGTWEPGSDGDYLDEVWCAGELIVDAVAEEDVAFIVAAHEHWNVLLDAARGDTELLSRVVCRAEAAEAEVESLRAEVVRLKEGPTLVALFCPMCKMQHVDQGEWETRPHKTHRCVDGPFGRGCGNEWRPALDETVGVTFAELEYP